MFDLPDTYRVDVKVALKDFIPKDLKPNDKKRIKDAVKLVSLDYQIAGEEIPSVNNEEYRCQVIQFYDIEVANIKDANFLASTYQNLIKPLCVIHMHDTKDEVYSMALKRLSQTDDMQIVVEQTLLTDKYMLGIPDSNRDRFMAYMNYSTVKNKIDKVQLYKEWFYKAYMVVNEKAYIHTDKLLDGNIWYDSDRTARICQKYVELVTSRGKLKTAVTNAERMKINKEIKTEIQVLDNEEL
ncbi:DUF4391 domain-containing protein [Agathobacter rectalis]|jgi:hypothetical protein|uniref:DUF4391 family protein n=1 Tax=Agathobacter rectalis TaxID=39491 RepID=A0A395V5T2_9FIRM|nr:DUF4391 domain-containing protein [Agathobacter rectalis]RGR57114.1 DUF4391 family protein [Agathobacter rectalis]